VLVNLLIPVERAVFKTMSSLEKRLEAFRQLPLRAQLALIASSRANPVLGKNQEYIEGLERVHAECLQASTPQQKSAYEKAKANLTSN
jgi:hypothetical protein